MGWALIYEEHNNRLLYQLTAFTILSLRLKKWYIKNIQIKWIIQYTPSLLHSLQRTHASLPTPISSTAKQVFPLGELRTVLQSRKYDETSAVSLEVSVLTNTKWIGSHIDSMVVASAILLPSPAVPKVMTCIGEFRAVVCNNFKIIHV